MAIVCPAVLAESQREYKQQIEQVAGFAKRIQIDLMDGDLTATESIAIEQIWWPKGVAADIHLMYRHPGEYLDKLIELKPHMLIVHAEAKVDIEYLVGQLRKNDIKSGLALLPETSIEQVSEFLGMLDHLMIFSGSLGRFGGKVDFALLDKVKQAKDRFPALEVGWDGGVNDKNIQKLAQAGVDVINVGGFIQRASDPESAYNELVGQIK